MKQTFKKSVSLVLALIMIMGLMPLTSLAASVDYTPHDDYYKVITKDDYDLAPGIVESEIVLNNAAGNHRQVAHVVEVDLGNPYTKVIPSSKGMVPTPGKYGVQIMSEQAAYAEANGYGNVVAAMNLSLSWYDSAYYIKNPHLVGEPLGYVILDGVKYQNSQGQTSGAQTCVVINYNEKDGVARPADIPRVQIRSTADAITGWEEQVIPANFGFLVKDGKNQYSKDDTTDPASRSFVGVKADGTFVMVMNDGRQAPYSTGFNSYEMAEFMLSLGCVQAVNGDGGGSSAFLSERPGEELKINCAPSDGAERETTHGVLVISTAPATGEFVRASISSEYDYYTPGSVVEFDAIGTDLVGTSAEIPADATWQLADDSFGTIADGVFTSTGKEGAVTVQMVYGGNVVGEDTIYIYMPDKIAFAQDNMVVPYGKTVEITINASYDSKLLCIKPSDVEFTLSNPALGTLDGFSFAAAPEGTQVEPGTLTAKIGDLEITANLSLGKGSNIAFDFEDANLDGWTIGSNYLKYGPVGPNGKLTDDNGNYWYNGQNELGYISIADKTTGKVRNGDYALAVECDFTQIYETGFHSLNMIFPKVDTTDAIAVGFWIYVPYDARFSDMTVNSVLGEDFFADGSAMELCEGWHYVKLAAPSADQGFYDISFSVDERASAKDAAGQSYYDNVNSPNLNGKYTFYIDDITVDYSTAVEDRENPVFSAPAVLSYTGESSAELSGQDVNYNNPTFEVKVADFAADNATGLNAASAKAYIDGKEVECTFANGKMSIVGNVLSDGIHTVKFEISDNAGNSSWVGGKINVVAGTEASTVKVVPHDPAADRLLVGSLYWMDVVASDVETIDKVEMVFDLNNASYWELEGMEVAEGFTASYGVEEADNIATITIERTGDVAATGEKVLASIPVRTWESHITEYPGYEDQNPATLVSRGIVWAQSIELALERGIITYVDSYTDATIGTFGMEDVLVDTELFFTNYSRKSVEGAQAWLDAKRAAKEGFHVHTVTELEDLAATCTKSGYADRTYCEVCESVVDWGTILTLSGHSYKITDGVVKCTCGEVFNGVYTDGKTYVDGIVIADGWFEVGEKTYYYLDGVKLTGSHFMNGVMYTFDKDGVYLPDYAFDGFYEYDDKLMFFVSNQYLTGTQVLMNETYYFDENGFGFEGEFVFCGETCIFDNGKFASSTNAQVVGAGWCGKTVEYVVYADGLLKLGGSGATYGYNNHGNRPFIAFLERGINKIYVGKDITLLNLNIFAYLLASEVVFEKGSKLENISTGAFLGMAYLKSINIPESVTSIGAIAFKNCTALRKVNASANIASIYGTAFKGCNAALTFLTEEGSYAESFAKSNGFKVSYEDFVKNGFIEEGGELYYYADDVKWTKRGVFKVDNDYYYAKSGGALVRNQKIYATVTNGLVPFAMYEFDATGKMIIKNGFVEEDGELYYYVDGVKWTKRGVFQVGNDFYYAKSGGALVRSQKIYATVTNGLVPFAMYEFDANGKMVIKNGFVEEDGEIYYYVDGVKWTKRGVFQVGNDFYYAKSGGALVRSQKIYATVTNGLVPFGRYDFDENGKMAIKNGFVEEDGELYYYENGVKWTRRGVFQVGDDYYYAKSGGALLRNTRGWASITNDLIPKAIYDFDSNGKIVM